MGQLSAEVSHPRNQGADWASSLVPFVNSHILLDMFNVLNGLRRLSETKVSQARLGLGSKDTALPEPMLQRIRDSGTLSIQGRGIKILRC